MTTLVLCAAAISIFIVGIATGIWVEGLLDEIETREGG